MNPESASYDRYHISTQVERAVINAGCLRVGNFRLASGEESTYKLEMGALKDDLEYFEVVVDALATHPSLRWADALLAVPDGAQDLFGEILSQRLGKPLIMLNKPEPHVFKFASEADEAKALAATHPRIIEDVVTRLGSVASVAKLLNWREQDVQLLAVWRREDVYPENQAYLRAEHYLVERRLDYNLS